MQSHLTALCTILFFVGSLSFNIQLSPLALGSRDYNTLNRLSPGPLTTFIFCKRTRFLCGTRTLHFALIISHAARLRNMCALVYLSTATVITHTYLNYNENVFYCIYYEGAKEDSFNKNFNVVAVIIESPHFWDP